MASKSLTFTEVGGISTNERTWQHEIGLLPYDTSILLTKESLIAWLKTIGVEVDLNERLPKYARFGTVQESAPAPAAPQAPAVDSPAQLPTPAASNEPSPALSKAVGGDVYAEQFVPTRKVRDLTGGGSAQISALFGGGDELENEAPTASTNRSAQTPQEPSAHGSAHKSTAGDPFAADFRPTRKVRDLTGGGSRQISSLFGGGD